MSYRETAKARKYRLMREAKERKRIENSEPRDTWTPPDLRREIIVINSIAIAPEFPPVGLHFDVKTARIQFTVCLATGFQPVYFRVVEHSRYSLLESSGTHADTHLDTQ